MKNSEYRDLLCWAAADCLGTAWKLEGLLEKPDFLTASEIRKLKKMLPTIRAFDDYLMEIRERLFDSELKKENS